MHNPNREEAETFLLYVESLLEGLKTTTPARGESPTDYAEQMAYWQVLCAIDEAGEWLYKPQA
jgi:hypothetical protein